MRASHEVDINAPQEAVWRALIDPELTVRWYHGARVAGDWRPGGQVSYSFPDGREVEKGTVVEIDEPRRLALETRFVFDEQVQAEPVHSSIWELERTGGRTRARVTFDVPDEAATTAHWLGDEGQAVPKQLAIALDPDLQVQLARRDEIGEVEIRDLTPDLVGDYQSFFDTVAFQDHPEWQSCYCSETHFAASPERSTARNRADMTNLIEEGKVTALLAYADGGPVAWCNYGETTRLAGVMHKLGLSPDDHGKVGSVACFVIASQYRRHGIARRLLETALERLAERGCTAVEAYPPRDASSDASNYRGPLQLYREFGFEPYREAGRTLIVRKTL